MEAASASRVVYQARWMCSESEAKVGKVFLQEHFHVQSCTYNGLLGLLQLGGRVRYLHDLFDQGLKVSLIGCRIQAGELQGRIIADAGVADHGSSGVKELLTYSRAQLF